MEYCGCYNVAGGSYAGNQLMQSQLFPSSLSKPKSAFTFDVLDHFLHLTHQGKTTAWDFYNALIRQTDNTGINPPPVCHLFSAFHVYVCHYL